MRFEIHMLRWLLMPLAVFLLITLQGQAQEGEPGGVEKPIPNCGTRQCVEVRYELKDGVNKYCLLRLSQGNIEGFAYSAIYASNDTYGIVSKGGKAGVPTAKGFFYPCTGVSDCTPQDIYPVTGLTSTFDASKKKDVDIPTKCNPTK